MAGNNGHDLVTTDSDFVGDGQSDRATAESTKSRSRRKSASSDLCDRVICVIAMQWLQRPLAPRPPRAAGAGWRRGGSAGAGDGGIMPPILNAQSVSPCWERLKELPPAMIATYCWPFS